MPVSNSQYKEAKAIWKAAKAHMVKPPLTDKHIATLRGTSYYYLFQELGWIDEDGWPTQPD